VQPARSGKPVTQWAETVRRGAACFVSLAAVIAVVTLPSEAVRGSGSVYLSTTSEIADAIRRSPSAVVAAYVLSLHTQVAEALAAAGQAGGNEVLVLDSNPYDPTGNGQIKAADGLTRSALHAAHVHVLDSSKDMHLKAVLVLGHVFLCDRNFDDHDSLVLASADPDDYNAVVLAIRGQMDGSEHLRVRKADALALEAQLIQSGSGPVSFESESFGNRNPVYDALLMRAQRGDAVRMVLARAEYSTTPRERAVVGALMVAGIKVRIGSTNEKIFVESGHAWLGSANATAGVPDQTDWGYGTDDPTIRSQLQSHFDNNFQAAAQP
jgi:hypothetical protein